MLGPVVAQSCADHAGHRGRNLVGSDADKSVGADADGGEGQTVIAGKDAETGRQGVDQRGNLGSLPLASLMA